MKTIDGEKIFQHNIYSGFEFYIVLRLTSYVLLLGDYKTFGTMID